MSVIVTFADASDFGASYANSYFAKSGLAKTPTNFSHLRTPRAYITIS